MIESDRTEWQVRCAFNAFCKRVLKNEAMHTLPKEWWIAVIKPTN